MTGKGRRDVGFLIRNVGSLSGFSEEPDSSFTNRISRLDQKCRKCRVFVTGESSGELETNRQLRSNLLKPLIIRDLNDAAS
jgi:hypothetical protein